MSKTHSDFWSQEDNALIESAAGAALTHIRAVGPLPALGLARLLAATNTDFDRSVRNERGEAKVADVAVARLLLTRRVGFESHRVLELRPEGADGNGRDRTEQEVLQTLSLCGGTLTAENLINLLQPKGLGSITVGDAINALVKRKLIKRPFFRRRMLRELPMQRWAKQVTAPDYVPDDWS